MVVSQSFPSFSSISLRIFFLLILLVAASSSPPYNRICDKRHPCTEIGTDNHVLSPLIHLGTPIQAQKYILVGLSSLRHKIQRIPFVLLQLSFNESTTNCQAFTLLQAPGRRSPRSCVPPLILIINLVIHLQTYYMKLKNLKQNF